MVIHNPWPGDYFSHVIGGERPPNFTVKIMLECEACRRRHGGDTTAHTRRSSYCERRDNCPTLTCQEYFSRCAWDQQCGQTSAHPVQALGCHGNPPLLLHRAPRIHVHRPCLHTPTPRLLPPAFRAPICTQRFIPPPTMPLNSAMHSSVSRTQQMNHESVQTRQQKKHAPPHWSVHQRAF